MCKTRDLFFGGGGVKGRGSSTFCKGHPSAEGKLGGGGCNTRRRKKDSSEGGQARERLRGQKGREKKKSRP